MATAALHPTAIHQPAAAYPEPAQDVHNPTSGIEVPRGPVTAKLYFYDPPKDGSAPFNYVEKPPEGLPQRNFGPQEHDVAVQDIRGQEHLFNLDNDAFEALANVPAADSAAPPVNFDDDADVKARYYPEVETVLLANVPGAHRVVIFDHTIRRANKNAPREPVLRVHIDQTPKSAAQRVRNHLPPADADALLRGRYRIINVWRPLNGPVVSMPLAFASGRSAADHDMVAVQHRYPDRTGETAAVKYNEEQRWYYWSGMTDDERLLLKCFDSDEDVGQWGRVPHTAFVDPRTQEGWPGRESIEVRALVFG